MQQLKTDYRKDISYFKEAEVRLVKNLLKEETKLDKQLETIKEYIEANSNLELEQLIEVIIYRGWVTKDKLTRHQLYESTKALVEDYLAEVLVIEANYN